MENIRELRSGMITEMRAKIGLISLQSHEEVRAIEFIKEIASDPKVNRSVYVWSVTNGIQDLNSEEKLPDMETMNPLKALTAIDNAKTNGSGKIYVLLDFVPFLKEPMIIRKIRDLSVNLENTKKSIIFVSSTFPVPEDLTKSIAMFDLPLPDKQEIEARINQVLSGLTEQINAFRDELKVKPEYKEEINGTIADLVEVEKKIFTQWNDNRSALIDACTGLTDKEIENLISRSLVNHDLNVGAILTEKKQIIKKSGSLEYFDTKENMSTIGGLDNLKKYSIRASKMFSKEAEDFGIIKPRGILLVGSPGTGKSLFAKAISNLMQQPLLKLDLASQKSKWYGESGNNLIKALKISHAIAPAIMWIDEIDKSISRSGDQAMHEESASMLGTLLTDMEEKPGLFFLATCNNPFNLPPELLNRFQKVFFVDLPSQKERIEIFSIQLKAVKRDPSKFDLNALAMRSPGYSGREIRNIVQESLSVAFDQGSELTTDIILNQIPRITPISVQKKTEIDNMREWSAKNAEKANETEIAPEIKPGGSARKLEI